MAKVIIETSARHLHLSRKDVDTLFGEYDAGGTLIREFDYDCTMQGYRTFKLDMVGFWFR